MALPINIDDVLAGRSVEWERLEFKESWNPEPVVKTLCAFANDFHNLGGGYIFIGVAESGGRSIMPPTGLPMDSLDALQQQVAEVCRRIQPSYMPQIAPYEVQGRYILVLHAPGGSNRPYKAPMSLAQGDRRRSHYIRHGSITCEAQPHEEKELFALAANVPFDDCVCHQARVEDLKLGLIRAHLQEIGSALFAHSETMGLLELGRRMNIIEGPSENPLPKNVGLMFFHETPEKFFPLSQIEVVQLPNGPAAKPIIEKTFRGPIGQQLRDALGYIQNSIIQKKILKRAGRAEADHFVNYPYEAIEEILCNAIYHRSYEVRDPIKVRVTPQALTITSYPGPHRSIRLQDLKLGRVEAPRYLNRRIGDFLKELQLTEGHCTGIPTVLRAMKENGSPPPIFDCDEDRSYLTVTLPVHAAFFKKGDEKGDKNTPVFTPLLKRRIGSLLEFCRTPRDRASIQTHLQLKDAKDVRERFTMPLVQAGWLIMSDPEHARSRTQTYKTTSEGLKYLQSLNQPSIFDLEDSS